MHPVLFFDAAQLHAQHVGSDNTALTFLVQAVAPTACCPLCGQASQRVHSRYLRQLTDLPCHGKPVQIRLLVRRFFCLVPECPRRIFAERLPAVTAVQA